MYSIYAKEGHWKIQSNKNVVLTGTDKTCTVQLIKQAHPELSAQESSCSSERERKTKNSDV
jgi:hypothetical protein